MVENIEAEDVCKVIARKKKKKKGKSRTAAACVCVCVFTVLVTRLPLYFG